MPKPNVQPVSRASRPTTSSWRLSSAVAAFRKIAWRAAGDDCDQDGKASAAAATALAASARVPAGTRATTSPVNGSRSSNVAPAAASTHEPPMNCFASRISGWTVVISRSFQCLLIRSTALIARPEAASLAACSIWSKS